MRGFAPHIRNILGKGFGKAFLEDEKQDTQGLAF